MKEIKNPTVSVIIPTYNRAHLIGRAIDSVLNQTFQDFEIIVIDDGSTDNTDEVVKYFNDPRIRYIRHEQNCGGSAARNTGIMTTHSEYIAFLDSDDEWLPEKLELQLAVMVESDDATAVCYSGYIRVGGDGERRVYKPFYRGRIHTAELWEDRVSPTSAVMVRRDCLVKAGGFDERLPARQDYAMWLELSRYYEFAIVAEPLVLIYDGRQGTISADLNARKEGERLIRERIRELTQPLGRLTQWRILARHYHLAGKYLSGRFGARAGRAELWQAVRHWPLAPNHWLYFAATFLGDRTYRLMGRIKKGLTRC